MNIKSLFASALLPIMALAVLMTSCNNDETYADQLDRERGAIQQYITDHGIEVISEQQFYDQDSTTDVSKNQFVRFDNTNVYMQIVDEGCGEKIKRGETATVLCRFSEYNILTDTLQLTNNVLYFSSVVDKMSVTNTSGTYTASFDATSSVMATAYQSTSVPAGWLVPLNFIKIGRPQSATDKIAKVNLIVPSAQGQTYAMRGVYPCYYTITYQRGR